MSLALSRDAYPPAPGLALGLQNALERCRHINPDLYSYLDPLPSYPTDNDVKVAQPARLRWLPRNRGFSTLFRSVGALKFAHIISSFADCGRRDSETFNPAGASVSFQSTQGGMMIRSGSHSVTASRQTCAYLIAYMAFHCTLNKLDANITIPEMIVNNEGSGFPCILL